MSISLVPGVDLHVIPTTKYKTIKLYIRFAEKLSKETISQRTLLSNLLETNSLNYPTQADVSKKLADMYGASFGFQINKKGDSHYITLVLNIVNEKFLPHHENILAEAIDFIKEMLFYPNRSQGAFDLETFEREKTNLIEYIESIYDDKQSEAALKLQDLYFQDEDQQTPSFGTIQDLEKVTADSLSTYYDQMLANNAVDILVIGDVKEEELISLVKTLPFKPRTAPFFPGFYCQSSRQNFLEKKEQQPVVQSKLNLGFRTGIYYHETDYFPLQVFNGLFGGFPHSKLFMNVREKESMAYYTSSSIDTFRGYLTVQTGIEGKNKERVLELIQQQLESLKQGDITDEELLQTKEMLRNHYILSLDNSSALLEKSYLISKYPKACLSDEEWLACLNQVTVKDIKRVADQVTLEAIYFLEGSLSHEED